MKTISWRRFIRPDEQGDQSPTYIHTLDGPTNGRFARHGGMELAKRAVLCEIGLEISRVGRLEFTLVDQTVRRFVRPVDLFDF